LRAFGDYWTGIDMITEPTVFILGAGASKPYGFPLGENLKNSICDKLRNATTKQFKQLANMGFKIELITNFQRSLYHSGRTSVDAFLEHRPEFIEVGKAAITQELIPTEQTDNLFRPRPKGNWYQYLFNKLNASFEQFDKNQVAFITFNYDRSLEQFLFTALLNSYPQGKDECIAKINNIPIIHAYGQLGLLFWQSKDSIPYGSKVTGDVITKASSGIKIINENSAYVDYKFEFKDAHDKLIWAKNIYIIGFGYDVTNLNRLEINIHCMHKKVKGTALGKSKQEQYDINHYFIHRNLQLLELDAYDFIRNIPLH